MSYVLPTLRTDGESAPEGLSLGTAMIINQVRNSWLIPGVTYTSHVLSNMGTVSIPVINASGGTYTLLCEDGTTPTATAAPINLRVEGKVSAKIGGCYNSAGIADRTILNAIRKAEFRQLAINYEADVKDYVLKDGSFTASTVDKSKYAGKPVSYFKACMAEAYKATKVKPTFAVISSDFELELLEQLPDLYKGIDRVQEVVSSNQIGIIGNVQLIVTDDLDSRDMFFGIPEALHIVMPSSPEQISGGVPELSESGFQLSAGFGTFPMVDAAKGISYTWFHKFYGKITVPTYLYATPKIVSA